MEALLPNLSANNTTVARGMCYEPQIIRRGSYFLNGPIFWAGKTHFFVFILPISYGITGTQPTPNYLDRTEPFLIPPMP